MSAYQIEFQADAAGKRIASSKRRILFRFGFRSGSELQEHVVSLSWSPTSGKTILAADGKEVHFNPGKGFISMKGKFQTSWEMEEGNHYLKIVVYAAPPLVFTSLSPSPNFRQFDLFIDGRSYFDLPAWDTVHRTVERRGPDVNESFREDGTEALRSGREDDLSMHADPSDEVRAEVTAEGRDTQPSVKDVYARKTRAGAKPGAKFLSSPMDLLIMKRNKSAATRNEEQPRIVGVTPVIQGGNVTADEENCGEIAQSKLGVQKTLLEAEVRDMEERLQKEKKAPREETRRLKAKIVDLEKEVVAKANDALVLSEINAKELRAKAAEYQEEVRRLSLDGATTREEIGQLQGRVSKFEEILRENKALTSENKEIRGNASSEQRRLGLALAASKVEAERLKRNAIAAEEEAQKLKSDKATTEVEIRRLVAACKVEAERLKRNVVAAEEEAQKLKSDKATAQEKIRRLEAASEVETERLKRSVMAAEEEAEKLKSDKATAEEEIRHLKDRITSLEKTLAGNTHKSLTTKKSVAKPSHLPEHITPTKIGLEMGSYLVNSEKCCLCCKDAAEGMQACQCGRKSCNKQAHATCLIGSGRSPLPSVSHPCTPAPVLPLILCNGIFDK